MKHKQMLKEIYSMAKKENNINVMLEVAIEIAYLKYEKQRIKRK